MDSEGRKRPIQIVVEDGEAAAVIVGMQEYVEMLERQVQMAEREDAGEGACLEVTNPVCEFSV